MEESSFLCSYLPLWVDRCIDWFLPTTDYPCDWERLNLSQFIICVFQICSVAQSCPALCDSMDCSVPDFWPSPTPGVYSNSCPSSWWCHLTISTFVVPFSSHLQSLPASGPFPVSQFFASGGQSIGVWASAPVLPMNTQDWSPLGWTGWISLQSKGLSSLLQHHSSKASDFLQVLKW